MAASPFNDGGSGEGGARLFRLRCSFENIDIFPHDWD
jgi:hypothetical protein